MLLMNKGIVRIFIVLIIPTFLLSLYLNWDQVEKKQIQQYEVCGHKENMGVKIFAYSTDGILIGGGKEQNISYPPRKMLAAAGFAQLYCLRDFGLNDLAIEIDENGEKVANTNLNFKKYYKINKNPDFKNCVNKYCNDAKRNIKDAKIIVIAKSILNVMLLYMIMLVGYWLIAWIIDGFKKPSN